ncbi:hypothetical protein [Crateriforma conspicua]|uniref:hypothetical protein n=1 Tax=Crateriforma conspicua TaxID=2527996 RepID=UPI0013FD05C0|nr:hypothetical protein [Crateriforma conspicua]
MINHRCYLVTMQAKPVMEPPRYPFDNASAARVIANLGDEPAVSGNGIHLF